MAGSSYTAVPLTAEALELLHSETNEPRDFGTIARMIDHGLWNTDTALVEMVDGGDVERAYQTLGDELYVNGIDGLQHSPPESRIKESQKRENVKATGGGEVIGDGVATTAGDGCGDGYDEVGGSFIAYVPARYGQASTSRATHLAMRNIAAELDCGVVRFVDGRAFAAHESSGVQTYEAPGESRVCMFVGNLTNRAALAESCDLPPASTTCAELVHKLYADCGVSFLAQLDGFFAFVLVDGETSTVFAATDRHGSIPLHKGRSRSGGVIVSHTTQSSGTRVVRSLGTMAKIPPGSYIHGNRHITPHKYARSADAERVLLEMDRHASLSSLSDAWTGNDAAETASVASGGGLSGVFGFGGAHRNSFGDALALRRDSFDEACPGDASPPTSGRLARKLSENLLSDRFDSARDIHTMRGWSSMTRSWSSSYFQRTSSNLDAEDDADVEEHEPESRMGQVFRTASFSSFQAGSHGGVSHANVVASSRCTRFSPGSVSVSLEQRELGAPSAAASTPAAPCASDASTWEEEKAEADDKFSDDTAKALPSTVTLCTSTVRGCGGGAASSVSVSSSSENVDSENDAKAPVSALSVAIRRVQSDGDVRRRSPSSPAAGAQKRKSLRLDERVAGEAGVALSGSFDAARGEATKSTAAACASMKRAASTGRMAKAGDDVDDDDVMTTTCYVSLPLYV